MAGILRADTARLNTIKSQDSDVTALTIDTDGRVFKPNIVAFHADIGSSGGLSSGFSSQSIVKPFNDVQLNKGNGFNGTAGRFTTPVAGLYHFNFALSFGNTSSENYWVAIRIMKNGSIYSAQTHYVLGHCENYNNNNYDTVASAMILDLAVNEDIELRADYNTFNGNLGYGQFCGYLIG